MKKFAKGIFIEPTPQADQVSAAWSAFTRSGASVDTREFELYCEMLGHLQVAEVALVNRLTRKFRHFGVDAIVPLLTAAATALRSRWPPAPTAVGPLMVKQKAGGSRVEGSVMLPSFFQYKGLEALNWPSSQVFVDGTMDALVARCNADPQLRLVLLDDVLGTGETVSGAIAEVRAALGPPNREIAVLVLVAHEKGLEQLAATDPDVVVLSGTTETYGIGLPNGDPKIQGDLDLMTALERRIGFEERWRLGYGGCQALARTLRTPNNVFPIYWHPRADRKGNDRWPAPFNRFKNR